MGIIDKMHQCYSEMTETEKLIYKHIMDNTTLFALKSIGEVAEELNISQTTLVRFAKMLGFDGYTQFKKNLQREEILNSNPADRLRRLQQSNYLSSGTNLIEQEQATIQDILVSLDLRTFQEFVKKVIDTEKTYIVGVREGYFLAEILMYRLKILGLPAEILKRNYLEMEEQMLVVEKGAVFIVFDYYPYSKSISRVAKLAQEQEGFVVLVTDYPVCPTHDCAELSFFCPSKTDYLINSLIGPLVWINLLVSEIFQKNEELTISILERREILRKKSGAYFD